MTTKQGRRHGKLHLGALALVMLTTVTAYGADDAEDPHAHHRMAMGNASASPAADTDIVIHDKTLINQDGESLRFATDVVGDHIVVMDFVYTTCTTVCPVLSALFSQLQDQLNDEVRLVSVSVDPGRDTPERLKQYAEKIGAKPGWVWLTGEKSSVDDVLRGVDAYTPDFEDHPSMVLIGDPVAGHWTRLFGFPSPKQILAAVDAHVTARHRNIAEQ